MDLRLASTYVPALVCAAKSAAIAMLARVFVPLGGASVLALVVALDRRSMYHHHSTTTPSASSSMAMGYSNPYLNMQHNFAVYMALSTGYDINAIQAFVLAASIACHERREHGLLLTEDQSAALAAVVLGLWMLISVVRSARPSMVSPSSSSSSSSSSYKELIAFAVLFVALMATHDSVEEGGVARKGLPPRRGAAEPPHHHHHHEQEEEIAWAGVRAISVVACVSVPMYTAQSNTLLPLLMRAAPIMLAPLTPAICFALLTLGITLLRWSRLHPTYCVAAGHHHHHPIPSGQSSAADDDDVYADDMMMMAPPPPGSGVSSASMDTFHKIPSPLSMMAANTTAIIMSSTASSSSSSIGSSLLSGGGGGGGGCLMVSDDSVHAPGHLFTDITGNEQAQLREAIARQKGMRTQ